MSLIREDGGVADQHPLAQPRFGGKRLQRLARSGQHSAVAVEFVDRGPEALGQGGGEVVDGLPGRPKITELLGDWAKVRAGQGRVGARSRE